MRKCSSFMCVLVVLLAGGAEAVRSLPVESLVGVLSISGGVLAWTPDAACRPFKEIYPSGKELIENMWGQAFKYETNEAAAYTMWWFEGGAPGVGDAYTNPNEQMAMTLGFNPLPNTCALDYFHKTTPTPEPDNFTECHPWHANACCHDATVNTPEAMNTGYGPGYEWDRCGPLSQACERFFVQEACFYECDMTAGLYRRFTDEQHAACSGQAPGHYNATLNYTCTSDGWGGVAENKWELYRMPIKASFADAWHRACANDLFCGGFDGNFFSCAQNYHQAIAEEEAAAAAARLAAQEAAEKALPSWAIVVIIVVAVLAALGIIIIFYIYCREKSSGQAVFTNLSDAKPAANKPDVKSAAAA